jgi:hypothetical protein
MDPGTIIQFHIEETTITRDFKRTVREIIQLPKDSDGATTSST